jgi:uncharacterized membrane protein YeiH
MLPDAAGLALFAVASTEKALDYKIHPFTAALLGAVTGVGGGTIRDIVLAHVPRVLQSDIHATVALVGAVILIVIPGLLFRRHLGRLPVAFVALVSESLRFISTGICRALRICSYLEHGENLERS